VSHAANESFLSPGSLVTTSFGAVGLLPRQPWFQVPPLGLRRLATGCRLTNVGGPQRPCGSTDSVLIGTTPPFVPLSLDGPDSRKSREAMPTWPYQRLRHKYIAIFFFEIPQPLTSQRYVFLKGCWHALRVGASVTAFSSVPQLVHTAVCVETLVGAPPSTTLPAPAKPGLSTPPNCRTDRFSVSLYNLTPDLIAFLQVSPFPRERNSSRSPPSSVSKYQRCSVP